MSEQDKNLENGQEAEVNTDKPAKVATAKSNKPAKNGKPGAGKRIAKWFRDLRAEAKKVIWPTKKQTMNNTGVVFAVSISVGLFIAIMDYVFVSIRNFLALLV